MKKRGRNSVKILMKLIGFIFTDLFPYFLLFAAFYNIGEKFGFAFLAIMIHKYQLELRRDIEKLEARSKQVETIINELYGDNK